MSNDNINGDDLLNEGQLPEGKAVEYLWLNQENCV